MKHFVTDVIRMGPAPTLGREVPVAIFNLVFVGVIVALLAGVRESVTAAVVIGALGLAFIAVRLVLAARGSGTAGDRR